MAIAKRVIGRHWTNMKNKTFSAIVKAIILAVAFQAISVLALGSPCPDLPPLNSATDHTYLSGHSAKGGKNGVLTNGNMDQSKLHTVPPGTWGGPGASFVVDKKSVKIEFDCAQGEIRQPLKIDSKGNFKVDGFYMQEAPGPAREDNEPKFVPAVYKGTITGGSMSFSVSYAKSAAPTVEFTVTRGQPPRLRKCR